MGGCQQILIALKAASSGSAPTLTYLASASSGTDLATYTFSALSFGTESATRKIAVAVMSRDTTNNLAVSSLTVGGVSATVCAVSVLNDGANSTCTEIWIASVPTGTSGDVVVNLSTTALRCAVAIYGLTDVSSTPSATGTYGVTTDATTAVDVSANVQANSVAVSMIAWGLNTATATWVGLTENVDTAIESSRYSSASFTSAAAETPRTITATPSASTANRVGVCAVFSP